MEPPKDNQPINPDQQLNENQKLEKQLRSEIANKTVEQLTTTFNEARRKAEEIKKEINNNKTEIEKSHDLPKSVTESPAKNQQAKDVTRVVQQTIVAIEQGVIRPKAGNNLEVLNRIIREVQPAVVTDAVAPYVYELMDRGINGQLETVDQLVEVFGKIENLQFVDGLLYARIAQDLKDKASSFGASPDQMAVFEAGLNKNQPDINNEFRKLLDSDQEIRRLLERYSSPEELELMTALFVPSQLEAYVNKLAVEHGINLNNPNEAKCFEFSKEFRDRIVRALGRLYQPIDEQMPDETWEEGEQKGGLWNNVAVVSSVLTTRLTKLRNTRFSPDSILSKMPLFKEKPITEDWESPVAAMYEKKPGTQLRRIALPGTKAEKVDNAGDFFLSVSIQAEHEIKLRKFLHNARALFHNPPPHEGGYYGALAGYAAKYLTSDDIDILWTLPDAQDILASSQLLDKLNETDYAKYDWRHQGAPNKSISTGLHQYEEDALKYLAGIDPELARDIWKVKRALIMGIGDNFSLSLRYLENGAWADPPNIGGKGNYVSYDAHSSAPFLTFNMMAHTALRFDSEQLRMGNLMFMPVVGGELGRGTWDHRQLMEEMKKAMDAFTSGRYKGEVDNGVVRFVDLMNVGRVGSIYSRAGWRLEPTYEGLLDRTKDPNAKTKANILNSWKAVENVGLEILKDFSGKIKDYDGDFYKDAGAVRRQALVEHIYQKYWGRPMTPEDFKNLEDLKHADPGKTLEDKYKTFFHEACTRGILQRIPTKFLRIGTERRRFVDRSRDRSWDAVKKATGYSNEQYSQAVKDICAAEVALRRETSIKLKQGLAEKGNLWSADVGPYELTGEKLTSLLEKVLAAQPDKADRIAKAVKVLQETRTFVLKEDKAVFGGKKTFLKEFASKWEKTGSKTGAGFPFAVALEELDRTLLAHKGGGPDVEKRAINDAAKNEEAVMGSISKLLPEMQKVAISGKKDFSPLIDLIGKAKAQMEGAIGYGPASEIAHHMSAMVISFFKKDTEAKIGMGLGGLWRTNSLAAEFAGGRSTAVWEWDSRDIDRFVVALESTNILKRFPYELQKDAAYGPVEFKLFGKKIKLPEDMTLPTWIFGTDKDKKPFKIDLFKKRKADITTFYSKDLRKEFGASGKDIAWDMFNKYVPIALAVILFYFIKKSFEEAFGGGKKK